MPSPLAALALLLSAPAEARPTDGSGPWTYDADDVLEHWDEETEQVRVHYSVEGPNQTLLQDLSGDGVPDYPQLVARTAVEVLDLYADLGLRRPLGEADLGLGPLGGSYAFDFYLMDFSGGADGLFATDGCLGGPRHCAGHMIIENDFVGYGYPSLQAAVDILTSHELFHGVQHAYDAQTPVWFAEGTAVWGERQLIADSPGFMWFANRYLDDHTRSLDRPPPGPVPAFAYGTALWWDFLTLRHDTDLMHELLLATESPTGADVDVIAGMVDVIEARGDDLHAAWTTFAAWNLASGSRAGAAPSYPYATSLQGITARGEGATLDDTHRFYPLAATYWRLDHPGGPLWFGTEGDGRGISFALHPVVGGAADGPVEEAALTWEADASLTWELTDDLPLGGYWLVGTQAQAAHDSVRVRFCLGPQGAAEACAPPETDTGPEAPGADDDDDAPATGCGCNGTGGAGLGTAWILGVLLIRRQRGWRRVAGVEAGAAPGRAGGSDLLA